MRTTSSRIGVDIVGRLTMPFVDSSQSESAVVARLSNDQYIEQRWASITYHGVDGFGAGGSSPR